MVEYEHKSCQTTEPGPCDSAGPVLYMTRMSHTLFVELVVIGRGSARFGCDGDNCESGSVAAELCGFPDALARRDQAYAFPLEPETALEFVARGDIDALFAFANALQFSECCEAEAPVQVDRGHLRSNMSANSVGRRHGSMQPLHQARAPARNRVLVIAGGQQLIQVRALSLRQRIGAHGAEHASAACSMRINLPLE